MALGPTHRELAACGAESKGRHPARPRRRNRWFADSSLEGSGFELTVPQRSSSKSGAAGFEEIANFLSNLRSNDS